MVNLHMNWGSVIIATDLSRGAWTMAGGKTQRISGARAGEERVIEQKAAAPDLEASANVGTPYDDVFKTMALYVARLLLPVLNELFGTRYTGEERLEHRNGEHFAAQPDGTQRKRMTDSHFVVLGDERRAYVIECQTEPDGTILIRIFEYVLQVALEGATLEGDTLKVEFPRAAIIALRSRESTPKEMTVQVRFPNGEAVSYGVPVLRMRDYALEDLFEKDLLFLLPFYAFTQEARFPEHEADAGKLRDLQEDFAELVRGLEERVDQGRLSEYESTLLLEMTGKVMDSLTAKYTKVKKGLREIVGGTVFVPKTEIVYRRGEARGEARGRREGIIVTARRMKAGGLPVSQIVEFTGLSAGEVETLEP